LEDNAMGKKMIKRKLCSKRRKGSLRMRWLDDVESDLKKMKLKGWKETIGEREQYGLVLDKAKVHQGFSTKWKEGKILKL
jgi:hypothetical protein